MSRTRQPHWALNMNAVTVEREVANVRKKVLEIQEAELVTCHPAMVQVKLRHTEYKQLTVRCQFPGDYPSSPLLVELNSKTIQEQVLDRLVRVCDKELRSHLGEEQVLFLVTFVSEFLSSNPFIVCPEELAHIKKELFREGDQLRVKQKAGVIYYRACQGRYFMDFRLTVPPEYPAQHVELALRESNIPPDLMQVFLGHASELSRQCVQPPLRRKPSDPPFQPKPSLRSIADYLVIECTRKYPLERCPVCQERALPEDPAQVVRDESDPKYTYRVYCGHMYHRSCLEAYVKTPPFTGGKKCSCGERIFHEKWNVPPRLAEERWAHQEARKREIAEVADFLGF